MDIINFFPWLQEAIVIFGLLNVLFFLFTLRLMVKLKHKLDRFHFSDKDGEKQQMEEFYFEVNNKLHQFGTELNHFEEVLINHGVKAESYLQHCGVVRFQAFENVGGDQSFAVALLDARGNGVVISSIFGREESRVYCKPVVQGRSDYALSKEEEQSLGLALRKTKKEIN